jgi:hypothetical protein
MTTRLLLKALWLLWPFLRDAVFKNRTASEVLKENWHLNGMFFLNLVVILFMGFAVVSALDARAKVATLESVIKEQPVCLSPEAADARRQRLIELLK